jgi:hypothetical protein
MDTAPPHYLTRILPHTGCAVSCPNYIHTVLTLKLKLIVFLIKKYILRNYAVALLRSLSSSLSASWSFEGSHFNSKMNYSGNFILRVLLSVSVRPPPDSSSLEQSMNAPISIILFAARHLFIYYCISCKLVRRSMLTMMGSASHSAASVDFIDSTLSSTLGVIPPTNGR